MEVVCDIGFVTQIGAFSVSMSVETVLDLLLQLAQAHPHQTHLVFRDIFGMSVAPIFVNRLHVGAKTILFGSKHIPEDIPLSIHDFPKALKVNLRHVWIENLP